MYSCVAHAFNSSIALCASSRLLSNALTQPISATSCSSTSFVTRSCSYEQSEQLQKLKQIVRGTEQFRLAEVEGKLLRLPTGDGGAFVFRNTAEAPVLCAVEISQELKNHPELRVRIGIHSGPINEVVDLNEQANIAGAGINIAQRLMNCGDAGHIFGRRRSRYCATPWNSIRVASTLLTISL
jgi:hypothetical protein